MADLSPAAQVVLEAAEKQTDLDFRYAPQIAAAALRAAADQVVPEYRKHHPATLDEKHRKVSAFNVRDKLFAIANELEGVTSQ